MSQQYFCRFSIFPQIKDGEPVVQNGKVIWYSILYFNIKYLNDPNFSWFIRFQCILHDSAVLLSVFENFFKLKRGDLISSKEPILENGWLIWSPLLYFNIKLWRTQILPHLLDFNAFYMIQQYFCNFWKCPQIKERSLNFLGEQILQNDWIIWSPLLFFIIKHLKDATF